MSVCAASGSIVPTVVVAAIVVLVVVDSDVVVVVGDVVVVVATVTGCGGPVVVVSSAPVPVVLHPTSARVTTTPRSGDPTKCQFTVPHPCDVVARLVGFGSYHQSSYSES